MNKIVIIFVAFLLIPQAWAQQNYDSSFRWKLNEELTYKVNYSFINLGQITLKVQDTMRVNGLKTYRIKMRIDSNPLLFWVNMHSEFEASIDGQFRPVQLISNETIDGTNYKGVFNFDHHRKVIAMEYRSTQDSTKIIKKEVPFDNLVYDGMTMIFFARHLVDRNQQHIIDAMVEDKKGPVLFNFTGEKETIDFDAADTSLSCYYLNGEFKVKGIAGVTGPYEGWFSPDNQHVPVYAKMEVFVGSVKIYLHKWKNWSAFPDRE